MRKSWLFLASLCFGFISTAYSVTRVFDNSIVLKNFLSQPSAPFTLASPFALNADEFEPLDFLNVPKRAFNFSSGSSTMNLNSGSKLFISAPIFEIVGGTVTQEDGATVVGGMVVVSNEGRFIHGVGSTTVGLFGNFTKLANGTYLLGGNTRLSATFGPIDGPVSVSGVNNRIEGNAYFQQPITLLDSNTTLTLSVDNVINQPIYLNGGTIYIDSSVSLGYGGNIVGPGIIDGLGAGSLRLSGTASQWNSDLTFRNLQMMELAGSTHLTGTWRFEGETNMVGGGALLDVLSQGVIKLPAGGVLKLSGVHFNSLTGNTLSLTPTSTLVLSDSTLTTTLTMSFTSGTILVTSPSTLRMGLNDFFVTGDGKLIIDGTSFWLDAADTSGLTLFQGATSAFVIKKNGGLLRQLTDLDQVTSGPTRRLLNGNVLGDIVLTENISLKLNQAIVYGGSATIDGSGTSILFAKGSLAQLFVPTGISLTLKNINLMRITNGTFGLPSNAEMRISNDVLWELDQDVVLTSGRFRMIGATDILRIRGNGGRKKLTLAPSDDYFLFDIASNTVLLEDIELVGLENVRYSFTTDSSTNRIVGAVALMGTSVVNIRRDTNMSLLVNGRESGVVLVNNNLTLSGAVLFGVAPENVLNILFSLQTGTDLPIVNFADGFCTMSSVGGNAGINFLNDQVTLNLLREKSLIAGERSFISGKNIIVTSNPIRIASTQFTLRQGTDLSSLGMSNPIDLITTREPTLFDDLWGPTICSYQLKKLEEMRASAQLQYNSYLNDCVALRMRETRGNLLVPTATVRVMGRLALSRGVGDVALTAGGSIHRFLPDNWVPFSASLTGGSKLEQRRVRTFTPIPLRDPAALQIASDGTFAGIKETDTLYVTNGQNIMAINSDFNILGALNIDENAELIFDLSNGAVLTFGMYYEGTTPQWGVGTPQGYALTLPKTSTIRFRGNGTVRFADGSQIICNGSTFASAVSIENPRMFNDDRPEIVVSDYAQLIVADHHRLTIKGRGKVNVTTNGEINVGDGRLIIGTSDSDYFDFNVTRQGAIRASVPRSLVSAKYTLEARCIFNNGFFNLNFSDRAALEIGDRGIVEVSLNYGNQTKAFINKWTFASQGLLNVSAGGILAFGDNVYAPSGRLDVIYPMAWDNRAGEISGGGVIKSVDGTFSGGSTRFQAILQKDFFAASDSNNYDIVRSLSRVTPQLVRALDYKLTDGSYRLELASGTTVLLRNTDTLISEDVRLGDITGVQLDGQSFRITSGGVRAAV